MKQIEVSDKVAASLDERKELYDACGELSSLPECILCIEGLLARVKTHFLGGDYMDISKAMADIAAIAISESRDDN